MARWIDYRGGMGDVVTWNSDDTSVPPPPAQHPPIDVPQPEVVPQPVESPRQTDAPPPELPDPSTWWKPRKKDGAPN